MRHLQVTSTTAVCLTAALLAMGAVAVWADWCPTPPLSGTPVHHAVADLALNDTRVWWASEEMEVASPYLNPCFTQQGEPLVPAHRRWAAQVMWIYDHFGGRLRVVEIGYRRVCWRGGPKTVFFMSYGGGSVREASGDNPSPDWLKYPPEHPQAGEVAQGIVGATYEFTLYYDTGVGGWRGKVSGPGLGPGVEALIPASGMTAGTNLQIGGENAFLMNDMGVAGHLETRYKVQNDSTLYFLAAQSGTNAVRIFETPNRYFIVEGSHTKNYYQTRSDIHLSGPWGPYATPTTPATTDTCAPGS